jgi:putative lipoic acid-binding regulatory protein
MAELDEDFLKSLEKKLNDTTQWPSVYMFKFIVPTDNRKIALIESMFGDEAKIYSKESSGGKYISITIKVVMLSALEIIEKYRNAAKIEGLIAL